MSENHREPEVPEVKVRAVERLDGFARSTLEELAITLSVKDGILQNACSTKTRVVVGLVKSVHSHIVRLMNSRLKGLKRLMAKVLWLLLKKGDWHERGLVTDQCHDRSGRPDKKSDKKLGQVISTSIDSCTAIGLCISRHDAAEVYSPEVHRHAETNPACEVQEGYCTSYQNSRPKSFARIFFCPGEPHQRSPNAPKFEDRSLEETVARARCPRSSVEAGPKCVQIKGACKSSILLIFGK